MTDLAEPSAVVDDGGGADAAPVGRPRRRVPAVVLAVVIVVSSGVAWRVTHPSRSGLPAARHIVASRGRFSANTSAAQAMYDASRELLREALRCRAAHSGDDQCIPLFQAAAVGQAATSTMPHCRAPQVFATRQAWLTYLDKLDSWHRHGGPVPELPPSPSC